MPSDSMGDRGGVSTGRVEEGGEERRRDGRGEGHGRHQPRGAEEVGRTA
jgi:hypothetical protein